MVHSGFQAAVHLRVSRIGDPSEMRDSVLKPRPLDCALLLECARQEKRTFVRLETRSKSERFTVRLLARADSTGPRTDVTRDLTAAMQW